MDAHPPDTTARAEAAIFDLRAERLARQPVEPTGDGRMALALIFPLGEEWYAFPGEQVREVRPLAGLTPLPGTPAFVAGLINLRGRIVPVIDLAAFFGLAAPAQPAMAPMVLILEDPHGDVGLLTTGRAQVRPMEHARDPAGRADLQSRLSALPAGLRADYVRGVTADLVVLLDAAGLLDDPRMILKLEP